MTWAFSRDVRARARATLAGEDANRINQRGIPYSEFFSHVDVYRDFPLRATVLSICFCCLYGLLYLASTTAFNSIVTGAVLYLVSISFLHLIHPRDGYQLKFNIAEHHIRRPPRYPVLPRAGKIPPIPRTQPRRRRLHMQHPRPAPGNCDRHVHLFPTTAACHRSQHELHARDPDRTFRRDTGALVYPRSEIHGSKDRLGIIESDGLQMIRVWI